MKTSGTSGHVQAHIHDREPLHTPALHFNANGTVPTEQDATRHTARLDGEIQPVPRQTQVAQRRAVPHALGVIQRIGAYTSGIRVIVVRISGGAGESPVVGIVDTQEVGARTPAKFEIVRK